jgi:hypothetical protein
MFLLMGLLLSCANPQKQENTQNKGISKHSNSFNSSVEAAMNTYQALTEAFVNWDSIAIIRLSGEMERKLDSINFFGFSPQKITAPVDTINLAKKDLRAMALNKSISDKRHDLNSLTMHLYAFLENVQYDDKKIYLHECPMAFNDTESADWLSESEEIRNPYLGLHHPKYGKAMIDCGETKATIDFSSSRNKTK